MSTAQSSLPGVTVFRGPSLEAILPRIRAELGHDATILCERQGVIGGIAGFFGRRCVEVEACAGGLAAETTPSVSARYAADAYVNAIASLDDFDPPPRDERLAQMSFAELLAHVGAPADTEPDDLPAPVASKTATAESDEGAGADEADIRQTLRESGFPYRDADELVLHAMLHARPFDPHAPLGAVVRRTLAESLRTPLGWKNSRRVIVLAGTEGAGAGEVAAALCYGYARIGFSVAALGLDGIRSAVPLVTGTEDAAVTVGAAEDVDDVVRALARFGRPQLLVVVAPTVVPGDSARLASTASLLSALPTHDLHLVLPAGAAAADATAAYDALTSVSRVKGLLPVALDEAATVGGVLSLALRRRLEIRWTASGADAMRVAPASSSELAMRALP